MNLRIGIVALLLCLHLPVIAVALPFRTVALSGQPAPGTPPGVVYAGFDNGIINENGTVVFSAGLAGPGVTAVHPSNAYGIWKEVAGVISKVVRSGEQAVGLPPGVNYYLPGASRVDGYGRVTFSAEAPDVSRHAIFSEVDGSLRLVARETEQFSGQPAGIRFNGLGSPLVNENGNMALISWISGPGLPGGSYGIFTDRSGQLELVIKDEDSAPGIPGARILQLSAPAFNDHGVLALHGRYTGGVFPNDHAVWTEQTGIFSLLARSGQAPGGLPAGVVFGPLDDPRINNAGEVMFHGALTGPGITSANDQALWLHNGGEFQFIAREGSPAAGIAAGANHGSNHYAYLNGAGEATFVGTLTGSAVNLQNDSALWSQRGDTLRLIAREGDHAPGTPAGVMFGDFSRLGADSAFSVNNMSQVAFHVKLTGPGVTAVNDTGIWVTDLSGALRLVAREGDLFDVNDDPMLEDLRTVFLTKLSGPGFNNAGELAIALTFTDNSGGVFVISTAVPEPSFAILLATAVVFTRSRRRRGAVS
ncbi:MAG TPA: choice-of-anchor tandem repeat NxxGxxAF-containing protein [Lacipirellulaceae bacterium]|nr:choice-of-anchor tandem repeat NxxGxxAF-containing protein [Lacipirellulaceae bacterium]